jgi:hypothetical protein
MRSGLKQILEYLLEPQLATGHIREFNERGWRESIVRQQTEIESLLEGRSSLKRRIPEFLPKAYRNSAAVVKAGLELTPLQRPYSVAEALGWEHRS